MTRDRSKEYTPSRFGIGMLALLARLPLPALALLGTAFGQLAYALDRKRRRIVATNLKLCFPELKPAEARRRMRAHFHAVGRATLCNVAIAWWRSQERLQRCVQVEGAQHFAAARASGRPVILMVPHFLSLEIAALRITAEYPVIGMYREPRKHLFHWALHRYRTRFGGIALERGASLKPLIRHMREGKAFFYLPDVDPTDKAPHIFVPFFGVPAATVTALSRIARLTEALVVPCIARERAWGRYQIEFLPALENFPSDDAAADVGRMNAVIEAEVRKTPAQYLWIHRRFKTRPPRERSLYE